jgi:integrase
MDFNKIKLAALKVPAGKDERLEWDDSLPGFGVRIRSGGSHTWVIQYRVAGRQRRESLGNVRRVELAAARRIARQRFAQVELGIDPKAQDKPQVTLGKASALYIAAKEPTWRPSTSKQVRRNLLVYGRPLHDFALADVTRADVAARLTALTGQRGVIAGQKLRAHLAALFSWCVAEGIAESNPVVGTHDPAADRPSRDRVLSDSELAAVWNACQDDEFGRIVRLLILTGARREEIGGLRWDEISDEGVLTIPGSRTKNHATLTLPLPKMALDILHSIERRETPFVFGNGVRGFVGWSYNKKALETRLPRSMPRFTLHDLRRTTRTGLGRLGVPPHVAELVIGHTKKGLLAVYDRHTYRREVGDALKLWASHVGGLTSKGGKSKIVALRA